MEIDLKLKSTMLLPFSMNVTQILDYFIKNTSEFIVYYAAFLHAGDMYFLFKYMG